VSRPGARNLARLVVITSAAFSETVLAAAEGPGSPRVISTVEELVAFGKERLGRYKYPREINVLSALPLTPVPKSDRKAPRELLTVQGGTR